MVFLRNGQASKKDGFGICSKWFETDFIIFK